MSFLKPRDRLVEALAPSVLIEGPDVVRPSLALKSNTRTEEASQIAEISQDMARRLFAQLGEKDAFYYPGSIKRIHARSTAVELAAREAEVTARTQCDAARSFIEDFGREGALVILAQEVGECALTVYGRSGRLKTTANRHYAKNTVVLEDGRKVSAMQYVRSEWAPQYAKGIVSLVQDPEAVS